MSTPVAVSWSGGKDSALMLHCLLQDKRYEVKRLITTVNLEQERVVMHGVRRSLLEAQADSIGIPLKIIELPSSTTHDIYNEIMTSALSELNSEGISHLAFGDIFLEDLKRYREQMNAKVGVQSIFPLWGKSTISIIESVVKLDIKAKTICVDNNVLGEAFINQLINHEFVERLPASVDCCGENGEYHTFVFDAPFFKYPINYKTGMLVTQTYEGSIEAEFLFLDAELCV